MVDGTWSTWRSFENENKDTKLQIGVIIEGPVLAELNGIVAAAHLGKDYRPVVATVLKRDYHGQVLVVQSAKNPDEWMFPQGGVDPEEDILAAMYREVREEVGFGEGMGGYMLGPAVFLGIADLDAPSGRVDKRGFTQGKRYIFVGMGYVEGDGSPFRLNPDELNDAQWVHPDDGYGAIMATTRQEKVDMMRWALQNSEVSTFEVPVDTE